MATPHLHPSLDHTTRHHTKTEKSNPSSFKMGVGVGKSVLWLTKLFILASCLLQLGLTQTQAQPEANFKCGTNATCQALIDYTSQNSTTLRAIQTLFNVKHLPDIIGANNFPTNTSGSYSVAANQVVKVPFPCKCRNGTGLSKGVPLYKIKPGDGLDEIARTVFAGVVKYQQIQVANNISDANNITAGDTLYIPLPCSCDAVGGSSVVHYAHIVPAESTVQGIAEEYGTTQQVLLDLNGITDPKLLQAGQVLDVPLRACTSNVSKDSLDYPLLVPNSTYVYTANECVKCKCDSGNNYILQCEASNLKPTSRWPVCPSLKCQGNLDLGNVTSGSDTGACNRTFCAYAGYNTRNVSTTLDTESFCPAPAPAPGPSGGGTVAPSGGGSGASRSTYNLFIVINLILLSVYLL